MTGFVVWLQEFGKVRVSVGSFKKKKKKNTKRVLHIQGLGEET